MSGSGNAIKTFVKKGVTYNEATRELVDCLFCRIHRREEPGRVAYEDDDFVVFHTIAPVTDLHLLVTTREHIKNVSALKGSKGAELVSRLVSIGKIALGDRADKAQYSFHIPPANSIDHLHLHAIASPETMSWKSYLKYNTNVWWSQSSDAVIHKLRSEQRALDEAEAAAPKDRM